MSQVTYEIIRKLFEIYPIILQIVLFLVLWNVFFRWEKGIWIVAGILAVMNICMGLWLEKPGVIRYTMSAVIVLGYCFCKYQKHLENAVFILLLFYNFHALSYLIADSIYQCTVESIFRGLDVLSEEYIFRVYLGMAIGMGILLLSYTLVLLIMTGVVIKIVKKPFMLRWQETIFLSVLNIVGSMIVGISLDLSVVQIEGGVFLLYDDKQEMLWKLPIIAVLIYVGEISAIYIYQNYRKLQKERQKHFVEEQQVKAMKQRLEEAENFYGSIRRVRHEMKNHMTNIKGLVASEKYDEVLDNLEEVLITSDVGVETTLNIIKRIEKRAAADKYVNTQELNLILRDEIAALLTENNSGDVADFDVPIARKPYVIMVVGVNGVGKTTTIGKLAYQFKKAGKSVYLGAADTFRAAAVEQLMIWGERVGVPVVKQKMGADPASVAYDTLSSAVANNADVVIIDTAGRLHNKVGLMNELTKIKNVMKKVVPDAPDEVLLVLDGSTGQNAFEQAKQFTLATEVTAMAITKLDGTAKGGVVIGISDQFKIPVKYIGLGEGMEDLQVFRKNEFVDSLFGENA